MATQDNKFLRVSPKVHREVFHLISAERFHSADKCLQHLLSVYKGAVQVRVMVGTVEVWSRSV